MIEFPFLLITPLLNLFSDIQMLGCILLFLDYSLLKSNQSIGYLHYSLN